MPDNYSSDPPVATATSFLMLSDKMTDMGQKLDKLAEMPQKVDRIEIASKQIEKDVQQTREGLQADLDQMKATFKDELNRVREDSDSRFKAVFDEVKEGRKETDLQIRVLNESKTKTDTIGRIVYVGGPILLGVLLGGWGTLSSKADATSVQSASNTQALAVVQKEQDQMSRAIEELRNKFYDRNYMRPQP